METFDVVIVGGGSAGLAAALVLARARRRVMIVDAGTPRNAPAEHMHGFLSRDGQSPREFLRKGRSEAEGYGVQFLHAHVTDISQLTSDGRQVFWLATSDGTTLTARKVLLATGLRDVFPDIPGSGARWGRDLLHCPYCHGYEVRDQPLAVLGGDDGAVGHAVLLRQLSSDITLVSNGDRLSVDALRRLSVRGVAVVDARVRRLVVEDDRLTSVELADGRQVPVTAAFVHPTFLPNDLPLASLEVDRNAAGWIKVDTAGRTSKRGLWAAGNVVNPRAQVATAVGEGSAAAIAMNAELTNEDLELALAE